MSLSIFQDYAEKSFTGLVFAFVCTLAAWYFGQVQIFDPLITSSLILLAVYFRKDINILTLLLILIADRSLSEFLWYLLDNTLLYKVPLYVLLIAATPFIASGVFKYYLFGFLGLAIGCEIYWYIIDYPAPWIYWQVFMVMLTAFSRRAFVMRNFWFFDLLRNEKLGFIDLDGKCRTVYSCLVGVYSVITFEYYARHILGFKEFTTFYNMLEYITGGLSLYIVYMLVVESTKQIQSTELSA